MATCLERCSQAEAQNRLCRAADAAAPSGLEPVVPHPLEQIRTGDRSEASGKQRPARYRALHEVKSVGAQ